MKTKLNVILLSIIVVLSMMPTAAFAEVIEEDNNSDIQIIAEGATEQLAIDEVEDVAKEDTLQIEFAFTDTGITATKDSTIIASSESGTYVENTGSDFVIDGTSLTIQAAGEFTLSGTCSDGNILVPKYEKTAGQDDRKIKLKLKGISLTTLSEEKCPIQIKGGNDVTISASEGTTNVLTDADRGGNKPKSCINASDSIDLQGKGSLTVNGRNKNGIKSDKKLKIKNLTLVVDAVDDGIAADKEVEIESGNIQIKAGGHGIASKPDPEDYDEEELLKTGKVTIKGGDIAIKSGKDGVHADRNLCIEDGKVAIESDDDALHGTELMQVGKEAGTTGKPEINIKNSYEGIEGKVVEILDGDITIVTSDDCINASLGSDGNNDAYHPENQINIKGGVINAECTGNADVIDSNGDMYLTGGNLVLYGAASWNAPLDASKTIHLEGTTVFAGSNMTSLMYKPDKTSQTYLFKTKAYSAGSEVKISDNGKTVTYKLKRNVKSILYTSPTLRSSDGIISGSNPGTGSGSHSGTSLIRSIVEAIFAPIVNLFKSIFRFR